MSLHAKAPGKITAKFTAIAATAAACLLLAPAASASASVQVTGKQLRSALLPASDFVAGYVTSAASDSGRRLEHQRLWNVSTMSCKNFWVFTGTVKGFGETAFAGSLVDDKTGTASVEEIFDQAVYQFASSRTASSFLNAVYAKYRSCRSLTEPDGSGGTVRVTVHSETKQRVGGHQARRIIEYVTDSKIAGPPLQVYLLWTLAGTGVYLIDTTPINISSPQPTQASLTLKLIARVNALK
jgi:hypothetical protein